MNIIKKDKTIYYWLRLVNDMSQEYVAEQLLISLSYVRAIEYGKKKPSKRLLRSYSILFNIDENTILEFENLNELSTTKKILFKLLTIIADK